MKRKLHNIAVTGGYFFIAMFVGTFSGSLAGALLGEFASTPENLLGSFLMLFIFGLWFGSTTTMLLAVPLYVCTIKYRVSAWYWYVLGALLCASPSLGWVTLAVDPVIGDTWAGVLMLPLYVVVSASTGGFVMWMLVGRALGRAVDET